MRRHTGMVRQPLPTWAGLGDAVMAVIWDFVKLYGILAVCAALVSVVAAASGMMVGAVFQDDITAWALWAVVVAFGVLLCVIVMTTQIQRKMISLSEELRTKKDEVREFENWFNDHSEKVGYHLEVGKHHTTGLPVSLIYQNRANR